MGTDIILVRHGQTELNRGQRVQGRSDYPLDEKGLGQARRIAERIKSEPVQVVYSSPLLRALETAGPIADAHGLRVQVEPGLAEMDVGELDGLSFTEMRDGYADFLRQWREDAGSVRMPGGESVQEVQERAWPVVERSAADHPGGVVVVVSHAFAIQALVCRAMGVPLTHFERVRHDVGAMSILRIAGSGPLLKSLNDRCHLRNGMADWPG